MTGVSKSVAGIDLGPSLENESTGVLLAHRIEECVWKVGRTREHWIRNSSKCECNSRLASLVEDCEVVVIDAPLCLESIKPWETLLISCPDLTVAMKPSFTYSILSHAWRAHSLLNLLTKPQAFEVFPASWFLLCEFDDTVVWKGEDTARQRKVDWFRKQISKLASERICSCGADCARPQTAAVHAPSSRNSATRSARNAVASSVSDRVAARGSSRRSIMPCPPDQTTRPRRHPERRSPAPRSHATSSPPQD